MGKTKVWRRPNIVLSPHRVLETGSRSWVYVTQIAGMQCLAADSTSCVIGRRSRCRKRCLGCGALSKIRRMARSHESEGLVDNTQGEVKLFVQHGRRVFDDQFVVICKVCFL